MNNKEMWNGRKYYYLAFMLSGFVLKPFAYVVGACDASGKIGKLETEPAVLQKAKDKTTSSTFTIDGTAFCKVNMHL